MRVSNTKNIKGVDYYPAKENGYMRFTAKTMFGLEGVLAKELEELGAQNILPLNRAVMFDGNNRLLYKANYLLRTALSILKPIYSFEANNEQELYDGVMNYPWEKLLNPDGTLFITPVVYSTLFNHSLYCAQKAKDAICDRLRRMFNTRPTVEREDPDLLINLHIADNKVTISLDSSGEPLNRRGYRVQTEKAPINEVVAAGLIQLSGWQKDCNFFDPMCGSGTLLIEAAMYAMNIPAQYYRYDFAFKKWSDYSMPEWKNVRDDADRKICDFNYEICGSDISNSAIITAQKNIQNAHLHKDITLAREDIADAEKPEGKTLIIMNPPYGERLEEEDINALYETIGTAFKTHFTGSQAWIISSNLDAFKHIGLKTSKKMTLYNSNLECRYCCYDLYEGSKKASKASSTQE